MTLPQSDHSTWRRGIIGVVALFIMLFLTAGVAAYTGADNVNQQTPQGSSITEGNSPEDDFDHPDVHMDAFGTDESTTLRVNSSGGNKSVVVERSLLESHTNAEHNTKTVILRLNPVNAMNAASQADPQDSNIDAQQLIESQTEERQEEVRKYISQDPSVSVQNSFWIANAMIVQVDISEYDIRNLAKLPHVWGIHESHATEAVGSDLSKTETTNTNASSVSKSDQTTSQSASGYLWQLEKTNIDLIEQELLSEPGSGTSIAVLDTGVDPDHPDIDLEGWQEFSSSGNPVDTEPQEYSHSGHGTIMSSIATGDKLPDREEQKRYGVAPYADLYHAAVLTHCQKGEECKGTFFQVTAGLQWAVEKDIDIASLSLGENHTQASYVEHIRNAQSAGTLVVSSTGNDGQGESGTPGNDFDSIGVGAIRPDGTVWSDSGGETIDPENDFDWGMIGLFAGPPDDWPDREYTVPSVTAPGSAVKAAAPGGGYTISRGTSQATAHVSGAAALVMQYADENVGDSPDPNELEQLFQESAWRPPPEPWEPPRQPVPNTRYGHGIIDPYGLIIDEWVEAEIVDSSVETGEFVSGDTVDASVTLENTGEATHEFFVGHSVFDPAGGEYHNDNQTGTAVELSPGESTTVSVPWDVEDKYGSSPPIGMYDSVLRVWAESDPDNLATPLDTVEKEHAFEVDQDDPDESTTISTDPKSWKLGSISPSQTYHESFNIENTGGYSTDITISGGSGISISGAPSELESGESDSFSVTLDAADYDGDSLTVTYDGGTYSIPISATLVADDDIIEVDSESIYDSHACFTLPDIFGPEWGLGCDGVYDMEYVDSVEISSKAMDRFVDATLIVEFGTRDIDDETQDYPVYVYLNDKQVGTFDSPSGGGEYKTVEIQLSEAQLNEGSNEVRIGTSGDSKYNIGSDTELQYSYFKPPELDIDFGEYPEEVEVGSTFRLPVTVENNGGKTAENVRLGISSLDSELTIKKWPNSFSPDDERDLEPLELDTDYFEIKLEEDATMGGEIAAIADNVDPGYPDDSFTVQPPNDPPEFETHSVSPEQVSPDDDVTYSISASDPDNDDIDVTLEVYHPNEDAWQSKDTAEIAGSGEATFTCNPFSESDIDESAQFRFTYETEFGHSGTWGPFAGPTIEDPNPTGPSFSDWDFPTEVQPGEDIDIQVDISDPAEVDSAELTYITPDGDQQTTAMTKEGSIWTATIPAVTEEATGQYVEFSVSATDSHEYETTSNSSLRSIAVTEPASHFDVELIETNDPISMGENLTVTTQIENTGDVSDTQNISLIHPDLGSDTVTITLDEGSHKIVNLSISTESADVDNHTVAVESDDDIGTTTVAVLSPVEFTIVDADLGPEETDLGEEFTVEATVKNIGDRAAEQDVTWEIGEHILASESIKLNDGEKATVEFTEELVLSSGEYSQTVYTPADHIQQNLLIHSSITPQPVVDVTITESPLKVAAGERATVDVKFAKSSVFGKETIEVVIEDEGISDSEAVSSERDDDIVSFDLDTTDLDTGEYTLIASSPDDVYETTLTIVEYAPELNINVDPIHRDEADSFDADVEIENDGNITAEDVDITLEVANGNITLNETADISANTAKTITLGSIATDDLATDTIEIEVTADYNEDVVTDTATITDEETDDLGEIPGFGISVTIVALLTAAVIGLKRRTG